MKPSQEKPSQERAALARAWSLYESQPAFSLGFHGCDRAVGEALLDGKKHHFKPSDNGYDWLGVGIYFWESSPLRALQFAEERAAGGKNSKGEINNPFVIGAIINPGRCLNLADSSALIQVREAYDSLAEALSAQEQALPSNGSNLRTRQLDYYVFNTLHQLREEAGLPPYDTVWGMFWEGKELYPGAGMREADHVQVCVRNTACILGYFRPVAL